MINPMISSVERLTSQETKTPPGTIIVRLLLSQEVIPKTAVNGHHWMRIESGESGNSVFGVELMMREMGTIFPEEK